LDFLPCKGKPPNPLRQIAYKIKYEEIAYKFGNIVMGFEIDI